MLSPNQKKVVDDAFKILYEQKLVYLNCQMRTGKTTMSLHLAQMMNAKSVLFVTPKKVVVSGSVMNDYNREGLNYELRITNYESLHKLTETFELIIVDEAHKISAYSKPSVWNKQLREIVKDKPLILLSGTRTPESTSQIYHQFAISKNSPFKEYANFYKWFREFGIPAKRIFKGINVNDYDKCHDKKVFDIVDKYTVFMSQSDADFKTTEVRDNIIDINIDKRIYDIVAKIKKDGIYTFKDGVDVVADNPLSKLQKVHQLCSGTVIRADSSTKILDTSKANYIRDNFNKDKYVIFYKYKAEEEALRQTLTKVTNEVSQFNTGDFTYFISQIQSGSQGINLSIADTIIYYNIDFSFVQYEQSRARTQAKNKTTGTNIFWLFSNAGIERKIYKRVLQKENYNSKIFRKEYEC